MLPQAVKTNKLSLSFTLRLASWRIGRKFETLERIVVHLVVNERCDKILE
jgi:hypothetical protein